MNYFLFHLSVSSVSFLFPVGEKYRKLHVSLLCNSYDVLYVIDDSRIVGGRLKSQEPLRCVLNWKPVECTDDSRFFFQFFYLVNYDAYLITYLSAASRALYFHMFPTIF